MLTGYDAFGVAEVLGLQDVLPSLPKGAGFREERQRALVDDDRDRPTAVPVHAMGSPSPITIEQAVTQGLPRPTLRNLAERLADGDAAKVSLVEWTVVPKTTLERRVDRLSPPESERTERVARLFVHARRALGSEAEARDFMLTPHPELGGRNPVEAARTDLAARRVEQVLAALEYGLVI